MKRVPFAAAMAALILVGQQSWAGPQDAAPQPDDGTAASHPVYPALDVLLQSGKTTIDQSFVYPDGAPEVTVAIVTMKPGESTPWHTHDAPLIAHILQGELRVDYGPDGSRRFAEGDTFVEAFRSRHQGHNPGTADTRILVVFAGADGTANTVLGDTVAPADEKALQNSPVHTEKAPSLSGEGRTNTHRNNP
jgi:quercetin dioxygenase-like cupin family protein